MQVTPSEPHRFMRHGRGIFLLYAAYFAVFTAQNIWTQSFPAYAAHNFGVGGQQLGLLYSIAGVPGVLAFALGFVGRRIDLGVLLVVACWLVGLGMVSLSWAQGWRELLPGVLGLSAGLACFYPVVTSLRLLSKTTERAGFALGSLKSLGPLAAIVAAVLIHVAEPHPGFRNLLLLAGIGVVVIGCLAGLGVERRGFAQTHGRLRIKKRLWPYYLLNFLAGCRSALFKSFAIFLLVSEHGFDLQGTALLGAAGSVLTFAGYNAIGYLVETWGSRSVLSGIYGLVALIFLGFAFSDSHIVLVALYCLDSLLFGASVATESHVKRTSSSRDLVGDIAIGLSLFSLANLFMPFLGGTVWDHAGREATFLLGSFTAGAAMLVSGALVVRGSVASVED